MKSNFDPFYFPTFHQESNPIVSKACIFAFSLKSSVRNEGFVYDSRLITEFLIENQGMNQFEALSLFYNFKEIIEYPTQSMDLILAIQKLFALSMMSSQILKYQNIPIYEIIHQCIHVISQYLPSSQNLVPNAAVAVGYALSIISTKYKEIEIFSLENIIFLTILQEAAKFARSYSSPESLTFFQTYFLNVLFSFSPDILVGNQGHIEFFKVILGFLEASTNINGNENFNYFNLTEHLLSFVLKKELNIEVRELVFKIISSVAKKFPMIFTLLFDQENLKNITDFISEVIELYPPQEPQYIEAPKKDYVLKESAKIQPNTIIETNTFDHMLPSNVITLQQLPKINPQAPQLYVKYYLHNNLQFLLKSICALAAANPDQHPSIIHTKIMQSLIRKYDDQATYALIHFICIWSGFFLQTDLSASLPAAYEINFFRFMLKSAFIYKPCIELQSFTCHLFQYLLMKKPENPSFMGELFQFLVSNLADLQVSNPIINTVINCTAMAPALCAEIMRDIDFPLTISGMLLDLRQLHIANVGTEAEKPIVDARIWLFNIIDFFLQMREYKTIFFSSSKFINALTQMVFEPNASSWAMIQILNVLTSIQANQQNLSILYTFFKTEFENSIKMGGIYLSMAHALLKMISDAVPRNPDQLAKSFLRHGFIDVLANFVYETKDQQNMFCLLEIFRIFSNVKGEMKAHIAEADLFTKLSPVFMLFFKDELNVNLLKTLWEIVFDDKIVPKDPHPIVNGQPLPLLFNILLNFKDVLIWFLDYVKACCEMDEASAREVNMSDLMHHLLTLLISYRNKHETDEVFEKCNNLFYVLAGHSMKGKDLNLLFQNLTSLPGNFRPFFTLELMRSMLFVFQNPFDSPVSMFKLNSIKGNQITPLQAKNVNISELSFICDINISSQQNHEVSDIFYFQTSDKNYFRLMYSKQKIYFEVKQPRDKFYKGVFNFQIQPDVWMKLAIVYEKKSVHLYIHGKEQANITTPSMLLKGGIVNGYVCKNINCMLGQFILCDAVLSKQTISLLSEFPRELSTTYARIEAPEFPNYPKLFDGHLEKQALCFVDPGMTYKEKCVNLSHRNKYVLDVNGQTFGFSPKVNRTLYTIGGISVLLPLFAQIDQPVLPKEGESPDYTFDPTYLPFLLQILSVVLADNIKNQIEFHQTKGFCVLAYLIERASVKHITESTLTTFKKIFDGLKYPPLIQQMIDYIFLNAQLWIYCDSNLHCQVYKMLNSILQNAETPEKQKFLATIMSYSKLGSLMRICLWENLTDNDICLLDKPKTNPGTHEVEAERPKTLTNERMYLQNLAFNVTRYRFTEDDAAKLCILSFDLDDPDLAINNLTILIILLKGRNPVLMKVLRERFNFQSFFPLLLSTNEKIRCQCIHIFMLLFNQSKEDTEILLQPFTKEEWIRGIITITTNQNTSAIFTDVVFGYLFGLFDPKKNDLMPVIRISHTQQLPKITFQNLYLLPLCIFALCDLDPTLAYTYFFAIDSAIASSGTRILQLDMCEQPFVEYLIHKMPYSDSKPDFSCSMCLGCLTRIYSMKPELLSQLPTFMQIFTSKSQNDYSHIIRFIYINFLEQIIIQRKIQQPLSNQLVYEILKIIFDFMFILPDTDRTYNTFNIKTQKNSPITFKDLHQIQITSTISQVAFTYGIRTECINGTYIWLDNNLAILFLKALCSQKNLFSYKPDCQFPEKFLHPLYMYSLTLSTGVSYALYYDSFIIYAQPFLSLIPRDYPRIKEIVFPVFSIFMTGIARIMRQTNVQHSSHVYMFQLCQSFPRLVQDISGYPITKILNNFNTFIDIIFKFGHFNFTNPMMEITFQIEQSLQNYSQKFTKIAQKTLTSIAKANEKLSTHLESLNIFDSKTKLDELSRNVHYQLLAFAFKFRNMHLQSGKTYRKIWRSLSGDNAPWSQPDTQTVHHYKVERWITKDFTRPHLIENYKYTDHKDASILRDVGKVEDAEEQYNEHLKQLAKSEFNGDKSVVTMDAEIDQKEISVEARTDESNVRVLLKINSNLVTNKHVINGTILLTETYLTFEGKGDIPKYIKFSLKSIENVFLRRYLLDETAVEIYTKDGRARFFHFSGNQRESFLKSLKRLKLPNIKIFQMQRQDIIPYVKALHKKWANGEISNFDFLMRLNIYSGRTYNDLAQYPVFPWVLADYTSETLDLTKESTFRDLGKPIGKYGDDRFEVMKERLLSEPEDSPMHYLYGAFYSSSAVVIGYMIRMEPFTSLHIELQSGRFDHTDRLFNSIPRAWDSVNTTQMDFRELTPEFYYFPDFLLNSNNFDLGKDIKNNGNVELPKWASSPHDFIVKHRMALESPYVSQNLHKWVDLVFGYQSRGIEAEKADNLYSPYFFETALTPEVRKDPKQLRFVQEYALCFGQAPVQLFTKPVNPKKVELKKPVNPQALRKNQICSTNSSVQDIIIHNDNTVTVISSKGRFTKISIYQNGAQKELSTFVYDILTDCPLSMTATSSLAIVSPAYDCCFQGFDTSTNKALFTNRLHTKPITTIASSENYYATGSEDCTVAVWSVRNEKKEAFMINSRHHDSIACIALNESARFMISCSDDGTIVESSLQTKEVLRIAKYEGSPLTVSVSDNANILINYNLNDRSILRLLDTNLNLSYEYELPKIAQDAALIEGVDGSLFVAFAIDKFIHIIQFPDSKLLLKRTLQDKITVLKYRKNTIYVGYENGKAEQIHTI